MVDLDLGYVDEMVDARRLVHGGGRGAPPLAENGQREGASLNRSCIVLLSAQLQGYVEEVFEVCAKQAIGKLQNPVLWEAYWKQLERWGNPNPGNVNALFLRIGIRDVLAGLNWQKCNNSTVKKKLDHLNQIRNDIAHGGEITVDGKVENLTLASVERYRDFVAAFAQRFEAHARGKV